MSEEGNVTIQQRIQAGESISYSELAEQDPSLCMSSPDGTGPHRPDDTTDPVTCAECGATIDTELPANSPRTPFDAFEVARVAEYPDPGGDTNIVERLDGREELPIEDAIAIFFTVYGHRSWPTDGSGEYIRGGEPPLVGAFALFDTDDQQVAIDLAYALADGKPVYDFTEGGGQ